MLVLQIGMAGTFIAQDLILFFVFFELVLLPMYFMIGVWGGEQRQYASLKFFLYTMFGSALMLVAFLALFVVTKNNSARRSWPASAFQWFIEHGGGDRQEHRGLDLRRHVHRLRRQGADVPVPHLAARRPHPGADAGLGDPGRDPAEARHLRLRPHRHPVPAAGGGEVGAVDRRAGGDRHHLRRARLPRADRHEAADRLLVGGPHGLRHARHLHADDARHQRRDVRHGRPRPDHRHAVLPRRLGEGALPHAEISRLSGMLKQMPRLGWILGFCAMASLGLPGLAGFWGEFPAILSAYSPAAGASSQRRCSAR